MSTVPILKNKNDKLIINNEELVMSPSNNNDDDKFVNKDFCSLQHKNTNEKLDELIELSKKTNKILLGNGEKGLLEKHNALENKVNEIIIKNDKKEVEEKEEKEKVKKTIAELLKAFIPYLAAGGGGALLLKILSILQAFLESSPPIQ